MFTRLVREAIMESNLKAKRNPPESGAFPQAGERLSFCSGPQEEAEDLVRLQVAVTEALGIIELSETALLMSEGLRSC